MGSGIQQGGPKEGHGHGENKFFNRKEKREK